MPENPQLYNYDESEITIEPSLTVPYTTQFFFKKNGPIPASYLFIFVLFAFEFN